MMKSNESTSTFPKDIDDLTKRKETIEVENAKLKVDNAKLKTDNSEVVESVKLLKERQDNSQRRSNCFLTTFTRCRPPTYR